MKTNFKKQAEEAEKICIDNFESHVLLAKKGNEAVTSMKGSMLDEILLLHEAVNALRIDLHDHQMPKALTETILSYITHEDVKPDELKGIPEWLKKLMDISDDEEDNEGEDDDTEQEGAVSDNNSEREALEKALNGLAKAIRNATNADDVSVICGHVNRRKDRS